MLDRNELLPFNFLAYGGKLTGDHKGMRYFLKKNERKYEENGEEKKEVYLSAYVWPEPLSFEKTAPDKITEERFEFSAAGREQAIDWLCAQYESRRDEWGSVPNLTEIYKNKK
ncbi:MAG: hypothetical protein IJM37_05460 [Lachnospiraceae bacterium]|nr:hypothetical protein [Lachnospiraceae bacterium]